MTYVVYDMSDELDRFTGKIGTRNEKKRAISGKMSWTTTKMMIYYS